MDLEDYKKIAALMLNEYVDSLREKGILMKFDDAACALLAEKSIHGRSGARDLRNNIRRMVEDRIAMLLVENGEDSFTAVSVTAADGAVKIETL